MTFAPITAIPLFLAMLLCLEAGRRLRARAQGPAPEGSGFSAIEGAAFGLFGLLLAFTFSRAIARYDTHRGLIIEETNDIGTAWLRLDLLPPSTQPAIRQLFRDYTDVHAHRFDDLPDTTESLHAATQTDRLQSEIWHQSIAAASSATASPDATKLLLPALNAMIDITATRRNAYDMHPPAIIFALLFAHSFACALLAGYGITGLSRGRMHTLSFAFAIALTIYATLEIEYPRRGLIRLTTTNQSFTTLRNSMK